MRQSVARRLAAMLRLTCGWWAVYDFFDLAFFGVCGDLSRTTAVSGFGQENTAQLS